MSILFRRATANDLPAIVHLLADDELGSQRELDVHPLPDPYQQTFQKIEDDPNHELIVVELNGQVIGTLHLMFLASLSHQGGLRAQVESVRVARVHQNRGIGSQMMEYAIRRAKERGAHIMQLTTHNSRLDAHRFYERLGFKGSHRGMKLILTP
jgi:ribosomal protein S18 acetylase RimI-like enzyme